MRAHIFALFYRKHQNFIYVFHSYGPDTKKILLFERWLPICYVVWKTLQFDYEGPNEKEKHKRVEREIYILSISAYKTEFPLVSFRTVQYMAVYIVFRYKNQ